MGVDIGITLPGQLRSTRRRLSLLFTIGFFLIVALVWITRSDNQKYLQQLPGHLSSLFPAKDPSFGEHSGTKNKQPHLVGTKQASGPFSECTQISASDYEWLATANHGANVTLFTFVDGSRIDDTTNLVAPLQICVVAAIVQYIPEHGLGQQQPIPGKGPDDIHLLLQSSDIIITLPPLRPFPGQEGLKHELNPNTTILYYAELDILNAGHYFYSAEVEWSNWRWALEWFFDGKLFHFETGLNQTFGNDTGYVYEPIPIPSSSMSPSSFNVEASSPPHDRPYCNDKLTAADGRWHRDIERHSQLTDEWGYVWEGDECKMHFFTEEETMDCLANTNIHVFGDSNSRRLSKALMSAGRWCHNVTHICQSSDDDEHARVEMLLEKNGELVVADMQSNWEGFLAEPYKFGRNSTLHFNFVESIVIMQNSWVDSLYDTNDYIVEGTFTGSRTIKDGARARVPTGWNEPDLLIVGPGAWDAAFDSNFVDFEAMLPLYRKAILEAYEDTPIVLRMSQSFCCFQSAPWYKRMTGTRMQQFDDLVREAFRVEGGMALDGRMRVVDPVNMNGRPNVATEFGIDDSNHLRASHGRVEAQMLLNSICEYDPYAGKASRRKGLDKG